MKIVGLITAALMIAGTVLTVAIPEAQAAQGCGKGRVRDVSGFCRTYHRYRLPEQGNVNGNWQGAAGGQIWGGSDPHPYWGPAWHNFWGN